jgi:hypothetical protein
MQAMLPNSHKVYSILKCKKEEFQNKSIFRLDNIYVGEIACITVRKRVKHNDMYRKKLKQISLAWKKLDSFFSYICAG